MSDKRVFEIEADGLEFDAQALWIALCGYGRFAQTTVRVREVLPEPPLSEEERKEFRRCITGLSEEATTRDWWDHLIASLDVSDYLDRRACRAKIKEGK